jgi:hypothetical protein
VSPALYGVLLGVSGLLAVWAVVAAALGHAPPRRLLQGLLGLQLLLLLQLAAALWRFSGGERPQAGATFWGYLVFSLLLLPGGLALTVDERTRYGTLVLGVACLAAAVVELRLDQTWG